MKVIVPRHLHGYSEPLIRPAGVAGSTSTSNFLFFAGAVVVLGWIFYEMRPGLRKPGHRSAFMPPAPRRKKRR